MKVLLYHKNNYIFDKTDDDLITISIYFKHSDRNNLKNNLVLFNFFQFYINKKISNMYNLFPTIDIRYLESYITFIFSKENKEELEKIIKYLFTIEKNYTIYMNKYLQSIEKYQYNPSYQFVDKIMLDNTSLFNDVSTLYDDTKKIKNNELIEYMKMVLNINNIFIIISGYDDKPYKEIMDKNINNDKVKLFDTDYFENDRKKIEKVINSQKHYLVSSNKSTMSTIILRFMTLNEKIDVALIYNLINITDIANKYYAEWFINYTLQYPYRFIAITIDIEPRFVKDILKDLFAYLNDIKKNIKNEDLERSRKKRILYLDYNLSCVDFRHGLIIREIQKYKPNYDFRELREYYKKITLEEVQKQINELISSNNMKIFLIGITQNDYNDILKNNIMEIN